MKVIIRGKNIELTEGIQAKVNKKLSMLDKYFIMSDNVEAKVLIRTYPVGQKIEVTIPTEYVLSLIHIFPTRWWGGADSNHRTERN